jgi:RNA polymerase sigma factor (sigma-70 family)
MVNWNDMNSEAFVKRLKSGDEMAFDELYWAVVPKLVPFLSRYFTNTPIKEEDIEEIANDTMMKVQAKISKFKFNRNSKLTTWIFEIAKNKTKDFLRQLDSAKAKSLTEFFKDAEYLKKQDERLHSSNLLVLETSMLSATIETEGDGKIARRAFDLLEEKDQDILRMRLVMSYDDIAKVENLTVNAIKTHHFRAKEEFKRNAESYSEKKVI